MENRLIFSGKLQDRDRVRDIFHVFLVRATNNNLKVEYYNSLSRYKYIGTKKK